MPTVTHTAVAWDAETATASAAHRFSVARAWTLLADVADPRGDDRGPGGSYAYPTDASWGEHRQADLLGVRAWGSGGALKLELRMHDVTAAWNPANGFDHVAFTLFLELPGRDGGVRAMPLQNASLPGRHALALPAARAWLVECIVLDAGRIGGRARARSRRRRQASRSTRRGTA